MIDLFTAATWIPTGTDLTLEIPNVGDYASYQFNLGDGNIVSFSTASTAIDTTYVVPTGTDVGPNQGDFNTNVSVTNKLYIAEGSIITIPDITRDPSTIYVTTTGTGSLSSVTAVWANEGVKTISVTAYPAMSSVSGDNAHFQVQIISFKTYDPDIFRIYLITPLELPWPCPKLPPNEWVTEDTINSVFQKFNDNQIYLEHAAHMYDAPPTNWLGWYSTTNILLPPTWHRALSSTHETSLSAAVTIPTLGNLKDIKFHDNQIFTAMDKQIVIRLNDFNGTLTNTITAKSLLDTFGSIQAIDFDSKEQLYVLDSKFNEISVFARLGSSNQWIYQYKWGGADTFLPKAKFISATDLHVDIDDNVFITDTGNACVKKFSAAGNWLMTIRHPDFASTPPVGITTDDNKNIHVLTNTLGYIFDLTGSYLSNYLLRNTDPGSTIKVTQASDRLPKKILTNYGKNGFLYVVFPKSVLKFTNKGVYAGKLTENIEDDLPKMFNSATQDPFSNLLIAADSSIYKYADLVTIVDVKDDTSALNWPLSSILIDRSEFVQDWVYNRSFARLWDNMEIFRRSIYDKFRDKEIQPGVSALFTGFFMLSDELYFPNSKEDIVIGMNELVTFDVVNRVIGKLCENQEILRLMLLERPYLPEPLQGMFYWCWKALRCNGVNPVIWTDLIAPGFKPTRWRNAISDPCCPGQPRRGPIPPRPPPPPRLPGPDHSPPTTTQPPPGTLPGVDPIFETK